MSVRKPDSSVSPAGSGTVQEEYLGVSEYWYADEHAWDFTAIPREGYKFDHWELDGDFGKESHTLNPITVYWYAGKEGQEDFGYLTAVAFFVPTHPEPTHTGLILRSPSSGRILHGSASTILRDE